jgi:hypothetical protein
MAVGRITNEQELKRFVEQFVPPSLGQQLQSLAGGAPRRGTGDPNGDLDGEIGSFYIDENGGAGTTFYVKESPAGTLTGWAAK